MIKSAVGEIANFIMVNYFMKYKSLETLKYEHILKVLEDNYDRIIVIRDDEIRGVGIYITLNYATFKDLPEIDIGDPKIMAKLVKQRGDNVYFVMLCADSMRTIRKGIRELIRRENPRTISWHDPKGDRIHTYKGDLYEV